MTPLLLLHGFLGDPSVWSDVIARVGRRPPEATGGAGGRPSRRLEPTTDAPRPSNTEPQILPGSADTVVRARISGPPPLVGTSPREVLRAADAMALPGHGPRPWRSTRATFDDAVDAIAARMPFAPALVVGYSMGARVALGLAARHPSLVAGMVLVGVDPGLATDVDRDARIAWDDAQAHAIVEGGMALFVTSWESLPLFATQQSLPAAMRARRRAQRLAHTTDGLAWAMRALGLGRMPPLWDALESLPMPIHLVTGALDEKFTAIARSMVAKAPRITHAIVPGAGHDVALEAAQALAREIDTR